MRRPLVGSQCYPWHQIYDAQGRKWIEHADEIFAQLAAGGIQGWEQFVASPEQMRELAQLLGKHGLRCESIYASGKMHTPDWPQTVETIVASARLARPLGIDVLVHNPEPLDWRKPENKTDDDLKRQAEAMQALGRALRREGMSLAYHTHDPEMRCSAREFHHMLSATDPCDVGLCLDAHWIYRGSGNSQIALYDIIDMYFDRIRSLHLRQSHNGVWCETLCDGDIDYRPLAKRLRAAGFSGPIIMEQAVEEGTPNTLSPAERQRQGREWVRDVFGA